MAFKMKMKSYGQGKSPIKQFGMHAVGGRMAGGVGGGNQAMAKAMQRQQNTGMGMMGMVGGGMMGRAQQMMNQSQNKN